MLDRWSAPASLPQPSHFHPERGKSQWWLSIWSCTAHNSWNLISVRLCLQIYYHHNSFLTEHSWWSNCDSRSFLAGTPPWNPPAMSTQPAMGGSCSLLRRLQQPFSTLLLNIVHRIPSCFDQRWSPSLRPMKPCQRGWAPSFPRIYSRKRYTGSNAFVIT